MTDLMIDFFDFLNKNCCYLVLRNWDNLLDDSIYGKGHEDIDILCDSLESFIKLTKANRVHKENKRDNYIVTFGNSVIRIDARWVGDGYYPIEMEKRLLADRRVNKQNIFIPNEEGYYYSLLYHALVQKRELSDEYSFKLNDVRKKILNTSINGCYDDFLNDLGAYLRANGLAVEYPRDPGVVINEKVIKSLPVNKRFLRALLRDLFVLKQRVLYYYKPVLN